MVGREKCGLMPIRGHSGVQGGAEVGAVPTHFPGGRPVGADAAREMESLWGFSVPTMKGWMAAEMIEAARRGDVDVLYCIGGNFLETLPDPERVREGLERVPVRVHQDIVVSPTMLAEPGETVILLPAATRYEQPGGGTETTTERRVVFSPEIPGRRIGAARAEWQVLRELAGRIRPDRGELFGCRDAAEIRSEIARVVPDYAGIERFRQKGDMVQWGGPRLCEGRFPTADGLARFTVIPLVDEGIPPGKFRVSTRRGKQFNSMVWDARDPLTGACRDDVLMSPEDGAALGVSDGDRVLLRSEVGSFEGRARLTAIRPRNLQVHWPEGNVLLAPGRDDPRCGIPDYNALVEVVPLTHPASLRDA
jgi:predicted molibdopterin-dependent oxidoreductase YjgC